MPPMTMAGTNITRRVAPLLAAFAFAACTTSELEAVDETAEPVAVACTTPAYPTPVYVRPANDGVALDALLEGAGYGAPTNSNWTDVASGNLCGGSENELLVLKNEAQQFSVLRGPTPYPVAAFPFVDSASQPWRAIAVGNLDGSGLDEVVAVRKVTVANAPDVFVARASASTCAITTPLAQAAIGTPSNSEWVDAAIGRFDASGTRKIALLKAAHANLTLLQFAAGAITTVATSDLDSNPVYPWKALAAGDLDGDGIDELVAARQVSDGLAATILVYKWTGSTFTRIATSNAGNTGNSAWTGITIGDFNGDGRASIVLSKNAHSNFIVFDLQAGQTTLRVVRGADLDSVSGQDWRGVTAVDLLGGDGGAPELVALRAAVGSYRTDLLVYGNAFHRIQRDAGLSEVKGAWDQLAPWAANDVTDHSAEILASLKDTHTNMLSMTLTLATDYERFVRFLIATQGQCVDGRQVRVGVTLVPPANVGTGDACQLPIDRDGVTPWDDYAMFHVPNPTNHVQICEDYADWGMLFGRLAQLYPHLVAVQIDDFMNHPDDIAPETLAQMQANMRSQAPWLDLVLETYSNNLSSAPPDIARSADTMVFYFRNDSSLNPPTECIDGPCGELSVWNAPAEIRYVQSFLPRGRKLHLGSYWGGLGPDQKTGTPRYNFDLMELMMSMPNIGGYQQYPQLATDTTANCDEGHFTSSKYCILKRLYKNALRPITHTDLTAASGAPAAAGDPFGFVYPPAGVQNIVYRDTNNHAHELWRTATGIGHTDLTAIAPGAPNVYGNVRGYYWAPAATQNALYVGTDFHVHDLFWTTGAVGHDNLTQLAGAPLASGLPAPYVDTSAGTQNVLYLGVDRHVHGLYWSFGAVGHDDLSGLAQAPNGAGNVFGYMYNTSIQNALYRGSDGALHGLWWSTGAVTDDNLTGLAGAPGPSADVRAYISTNDNLQHAIYTGVDGHVHELYWALAGVGHDDLTNDTHAPVPASGATPTGFFTTSDGTQHVVYRDTLGHVRELSWTTGGITDDDLSAVVNAPTAAGDPAAYIAPDGSRHVVYRDSSGRLHELVH